MKEACEALDRLVDIDPYDYRNQERIAKLRRKGRSGLSAKRAVPRGQGRYRFHPHRWFYRRRFGSRRRPARRFPKRCARSRRSKISIVQVEIFLQYSLQSKAIERLERIAELFPGEEERNERLRALYERANWWPKGVRRLVRCQRRCARCRAALV